MRIFWSFWDSNWLSSLLIFHKMVKTQAIIQIDNLNSMLPIFWWQSILCDHWFITDSSYLKGNEILNNAIENYLLITYPRFRSDLLKFIGMYLILSITTNNNTFLLTINQSLIQLLHCNIYKNNSHFLIEFPIAGLFESINTFEEFSIFVKSKLTIIICLVINSVYCIMSANVDKQ